MIGEKRQEIIIWIVLAAALLLLPSRNPPMDSVFFAASARWGFDLWQSHHLLFNGFFYGLSQLTGIRDTLGLIAFTNGVAVLVSLWLLRCLILLPNATIHGVRPHPQPLPYREGSQNNFSPLWLLLAGGSFATLRFATEGEAYSLGLPFSLGALLLAKQGKSIWLVVGLSALAFCIHQIALAWLVGIFWIYAKNKPLSVTVKYVFSTLLLVSTAYCLVALLAHLSISEVVFGEFSKGGINSEYKLGVFLKWGGAICKTLIWLPTFKQLSGFGLYRILYLVLYIGFFANILLAILAFLYKIVYKRVAQEPHMASAFKSPYFLILVTQMALALWAQGNSEFLSQAPFAFTLWAAGQGEWRTAQMWVVPVVFSFNVALGLLPAHTSQMKPEYWYHAQKLRQHPELNVIPVFIDENEDSFSLVYWWYYYEYGEPPKNLKNVEPIFVD